jgi:hypothetical protein
LCTSVLFSVMLGNPVIVSGDREGVGRRYVRLLALEVIRRGKVVWQHTCSKSSAIPSPVRRLSLHWTTQGRYTIDDQADHVHEIELEVFVGSGTAASNLASLLSIVDVRVAALCLRWNTSYTAERSARYRRQIVKSDLRPPMDSIRR